MDQDTFSSQLCTPQSEDHGGCIKLTSVDTHVQVPEAHGGNRPDH